VVETVAGPGDALGTLTATILGGAQWGGGRRPYCDGRTLLSHGMDSTRRNVRSALRRTMERLWDEAESAYRKRILEALPIDPTVRLLDVGCEDGAWTEQVRLKLNVAPEQVRVIEAVPALAERASTRGFEVLHADLDERWPLEDGSVDVVHANQVIEHVKSLDHFVSELARVLVRGGLAIVCTENLASWHNIGALVLGLQPFSLTNVSNRRHIGNPLALHADEPLPDQPGHVHVITLTALRDLFVLHGLEIEASWGTGYHPLPGRLAARLAELDPRHAHFIAVVARAR
jgi:SAM-dependent methyltransferase